MTNDCVKCFMHKFPNLEQLNLRNSESYPLTIAFLDFKKLLVDVIPDFFTFASKLNFYDLCFGLSKQGDEDDTVAAISDTEAIYK